MLGTRLLTRIHIDTVANLNLICVVVSEMIFMNIFMTKILIDGMHYVFVCKL